ncbi:MAG: 4Fe-4S dicluster domain-containing protein [Clostridiaceae bacterium]|nr:4Fe-4S dicluster domain-containing protein [Clostridiaceae bacterium]
MINLYDKKSDCYGCGACANSCIYNAITMVPDQQGFLYPHIEQEKCVNCGLCKKSCPIALEEKHKNEKCDEVLGVKNQDIIREKSSSGGIYTALSDWILEQNGVCIGVQYNEKMEVVHAEADNKEQRDAFLGSKYVQSNIGFIYRRTYEILNSGKLVMFSGTPCQIAGLKQFLKNKKYDEDLLVLVDIVCHGVPSPKIWKDYVSFIEKKYHGKLEDYSFRDKEVGWRGYHIRVNFANGNVIKDNHITQSFAKLFLRDCMLRPSCFYCPYASLSSVGDITIGDFWGIEKIDSDFSDNKGISMVLSNTSKGNKIVSTLLDLLSLKNSSYSSDVLKQHNLFNSTNYGEIYDEFWHLYSRKGFTAVAAKWGGYGKLRFLRRVKASILYRLAGY